MKRGMKPQQAAKIRAAKGIKETKLQKLRVERNLSQSELSELSGVPLRRIKHYEQNHGAIDNAKLETLCLLCDTLNCRIEDIIENAELIDKYIKL